MEPFFPYCFKAVISNIFTSTKVLEIVSQCKFLMSWNQVKSRGSDWRQTILEHDRYGLSGDS